MSYSNLSVESTLSGSTSEMSDVKILNDVSCDIDNVFLSCYDEENKYCHNYIGNNDEYQPHEEIKKNPVSLFGKIKIFVNNFAKKIKAKK